MTSHRINIHKLTCPNAPLPIYWSGWKDENDNGYRLYIRTHTSKSSKAKCDFGVYSGQKASSPCDAGHDVLCLSKLFL